MTFICCVKVNDGVVLSADSAMTLHRPPVEFISEGSLRKEIIVSNIYNNANKIFLLCDSAPVGVLVEGSLIIGGISITNLIKEFRQRAATKGDDFEVLSGDYTVKQVSVKLQKFLESKLKDPYKGQYEGESFKLGPNCCRLRP
jgi:hypothetical protein